MEGNRLLKLQQKLASDQRDKARREQEFRSQPKDQSNVKREDGEPAKSGTKTTAASSSSSPMRSAKSAPITPAKLKSSKPDTAFELGSKKSPAPSPSKGAVVKSQLNDSAPPSKSTLDDELMLSNPIAYFANNPNGDCKFIHLLPTGETNGFIVNPYAVRVANSNEILNKPHYTMTASGVTYISKDGTSEFTSLPQWVKESKAFAITSMKSFRTFRVFKCFKIWRSFIRRQRYEHARSSLSRSLMLFTPAFQSALLKILSLRLEIAKFKCVVILPQGTQTVDDFGAHQNRVRKDFKENTTAVLDKIVNILEGLCNSVCDPDRVSKYKPDVGDAKPRGTSVRVLLMLDAERTAERARIENTVASEVQYMGRMLRLVDLMLTEAYGGMMSRDLLDACKVVQGTKNSVFRSEVIFTDQSQAGQAVLIPSESQVCNCIDDLYKEVVRCLQGLPRVILYSSFKKLLQSLDCERNVCVETQAIGCPTDQVVITKMKDAIKDSFTQSSDVVGSYSVFHPIFVFGKTLLNQPHQISTLSVAHLRKEFSRCLQWTDDVSHMQTSTSRGIITIDGKRLKLELMPIPVMHVTRLKDTVQDMVRVNMDALQTKMRGFLMVLAKEPSNTVEEYVEFVQFLEQMPSESVTITAQVEEVDLLKNLLEEYGTQLSTADVQKHSLLHTTLNRYTQSMLTANSTRERLMPIQIKALSKAVGTINSACNNIMMYVDRHRHHYYRHLMTETFTTPDHPPNIVINELAEIEAQTSDMSIQAVKLMEYQRILGQTVDATEVVVGTASHVARIRELWNILEAWQDCVQRYRNTPFSKLSPEELSTDIHAINDRLEKIELDLDKAAKTSTVNQELIQAENPVLITLKKSLKQYNSILPRLVELANPAMTARHWTKIFEAFAHDLMAHSDLIQSVVATAIGEKQFEDALRSARTVLISLEFDVAVAHHKRYLYSITNIVALKNALQQCEVQLSQMIESPYYSGYRGVIDMYSERCAGLVRVMMTIDTVQKMWLSMEPIFASETVSKSMPVVAAKFKAIDKNWKNIMRHFINNKLVVVIGAPSTSNKDSVTSGLELPAIQYEPSGVVQLYDECQSVLSTISPVIDSHRYTEPRFYNLSDKQVLEFVSVRLDNILDVSTSSSLMRMYGPGVHCLVLAGLDQAVQEQNDDEMGTKQQDVTREKERVRIVGVQDAKGEVLRFVSAIPLRGMPMDWMKKLDTAIAESLNAHVHHLLQYKEACELYNHLISDDNVPYPIQVLVLVQQILWTEIVTQCLETGDTANLRKVKKTIQSQRDVLLGKLHQADSEAVLSAVRVLLSWMTYNESVVDTLIECKACSVNDINWQCSLRYYLNGNSILVKIGWSSLEYGNYYLGQLSPVALSSTSTTIKAVLLAATHQSQFPGAILVDPFDMKKDKFIQLLSVIYGRPMISMECESYGADMMLKVKRLLLGNMQTGGWCYLSHVNRMTASHFCGLVDALNSLGLLWGNKKSASGSVLGTSFSLHQSSALFLSVDGPFVDAEVEMMISHIHSIMRPISLCISPDSTDLMSCLFSANGFTRSAVLANRLCHGVKAINSLLSNVVDMSGDIIDDIITTAGKLIKNNEETSELVGVYESCMHHLVPLVGQDSCQLLSEVLTAALQCSPALLDDVAWLKESARVALNDDMHLNDPAEFMATLIKTKSVDDGLPVDCMIALHGIEMVVYKVVQLYYCIARSDRVVLVGSRCSAKSLALYLLTKVMKKEITLLDVDALVAEAVAYRERDVVSGLVSSLPSPAVALTVQSDNTSHPTESDGVKYEQSILQRVLQSCPSGNAPWLLVDGIDQTSNDLVCSLARNTYSAPDGSHIDLPKGSKLIIETDQQLDLGSSFSLVNFADELPWQTRVLWWISGMSTRDEFALPTARRLWYLFVKYMTLSLQTFDLAPVESMFIILQGFLNQIYKNPDITPVLKRDKIESMIDIYFVYSLIWSIGGQLPNEDLVKFSEFMANVDSELKFMPKSGSVSSVFDLYIPEYADEMAQLTIPDGRQYINKDLDLGSITIATTDLLRYTYLLHRVILGGGNAWLYGDYGTGKSTILRHLIGHAILNTTLPHLPGGDASLVTHDDILSDELFVVPLHMYNCTPDDIHGVIRNRMKLKMKKVYCPYETAGVTAKNLLICIDELQLESNVVKFLKNALDSHGFFDVDSCNSKLVRGLQVIGVSDTNTLPRLNKQTVVCCVRAPARESVVNIASSLLNSYMHRSHPSIAGFSLPLAEASGALAEYMATNYKIKFTLHDVIRVVEGIMRLPGEEHLSHYTPLAIQNLLVKAWLMQAKAVYEYRIPLNIDRSLCVAGINDVLSRCVRLTAPDSLADGADAPIYTASDVSDSIWASLKLVDKIKHDADDDEGANVDTLTYMPCSRQQLHDALTSWFTEVSQDKQSEPIGCILPIRPQRIVMSPDLLEICMMISNCFRSADLFSLASLTTSLYLSSPAMSTGARHVALCHNKAEIVLDACQVCAFGAGLECFSIVPQSQSGDIGSSMLIERDFMSSMKMLIKECGLSGVPVALFVRDDVLRRITPSCWNLLRAVMRKADLFDYFTTEEWAAMSRQLGDQVSGFKASVGTDIFRDDIHSSSTVYSTMSYPALHNMNSMATILFYVNLYKSLHIVLDVSSSEAMSKLMSIPGHSSACSFIYVPDKSTLVADLSLGDDVDSTQLIELVAKIHSNTRIKMLNDVSQNNDDHISALTDCLNGAKCNVMDVVNSQTSSCVFDQFVDVFSRVYLDRKQQLAERVGVLSTSVAAIQFAEQHLSTVENFISVLQPEISDLSNELKSAQEVLKNHLNEMNAHEAVVTAQQDKIKKQINEISALSTAVSAIRSAVNAECDRAKRAINKLTDADISDLRDEGPSDPRISNVLEAMCVLFDKKPTMESAASMLYEESLFLAQLKLYNKDSVSHETSAALYNYMLQPEFKPQMLSDIIPAAGALASFIMSIQHYQTAMENVAPKERTLAELKEVLRNDQHAASESKVVLEQMQQTAQQDEQLVETLNSSRNSAMHRMEDMTNRIKRIKILLDVRQSHEAQWSQELDRYKRQLDNLIYDSVIIAAFIVYGGSVVNQYRDDLVSYWCSMVPTAVTPSDMKEVINDYLAPEHSSAESMSASGMPAGYHEAANLIGCSDPCIPLVFDPSGIASSYYSSHIDSLVVLFADCPTFVHDLLDAVSDGRTVWINNFNIDKCPKIVWDLMYNIKNLDVDGIEPLPLVYQQTKYTVHNESNVICCLATSADAFADGMSVPHNLFLGPIVFDKCNVEEQILQIIMAIEYPKFASAYVSTRSNVADLEDEKRRCRWNIAVAIHKHFVASLGQSNALRQTSVNVNGVDLRLEDKHGVHVFDDVISMDALAQVTDLYSTICNNILTASTGGGYELIGVTYSAYRVLASDMSNVYEAYRRFLVKNSDHYAVKFDVFCTMLRIAMESACSIAGIGAADDASDGAGRAKGRVSALRQALFSSMHNVLASGVLPEHRMSLALMLCATASVDISRISDIELNAYNWLASAMSQHMPVITDHVTGCPVKIEDRLSWLQSAHPEFHDVSHVSITALKSYALADMDSLLADGSSNQPNEQQDVPTGSSSNLAGPWSYHSLTTFQKVLLMMALDEPNAAAVQLLAYLKIRLMSRTQRATAPLAARKKVTKAGGQQSANLISTAVSMSPWQPIKVIISKETRANGASLYKHLAGALEINPKAKPLTSMHVTDVNVKAVVAALSLCASRGHWLLLVHTDCDAARYVDDIISHMYHTSGSGVNADFRLFIAVNVDRRAMEHSRTLGLYRCALPFVWGEDGAFYQASASSTPSGAIDSRSTTLKTLTGFISPALIMENYMKSCMTDTFISSAKSPSMLQGLLLSIGWLTTMLVMRRCNHGWDYTCPTASDVKSMVKFARFVCDSSSLLPSLPLLHDVIVSMLTWRSIDYVPYRKSTCDVVGLRALVERVFNSTWLEQCTKGLDIRSRYVPPIPMPSNNFMDTIGIIEYYAAQSQVEYWMPAQLDMPLWTNTNLFGRMFADSCRLSPSITTSRALFSCQSLLPVASSLGGASSVLRQLHDLIDIEPDLPIRTAVDNDPMLPLYKLERKAITEQLNIVKSALNGLVDSIDDYTSSCESNLILTANDLLNDKVPCEWYKGYELMPRGVVQFLHWLLRRREYVAQMASAKQGVLSMQPMPLDLFRSDHFDAMLTLISLPLSRQSSSSLTDIKFKIEVVRSSQPQPNTLQVTGLVMDSAAWNTSTKTLTDIEMVKKNCTLGSCFASIPVLTIKPTVSTAKSSDLVVYHGISLPATGPLHHWYMRGYNAFSVCENA